MADPISTAASAVTIIDRIARAAHSLMRWLGRKPSVPQIHDGPHKFELRPISFMVDLVQTVPFVELRYYAINHLNRKLTVTEAKVTQFRTSGGMHIEHIPMVQEFPVAPRTSFMVFFRRNLMDSEARALMLEKTPLPANGSFSLTAKAKCGRREYTYGPVSSMWIEGWVNKPTSA